MECWSITSGMQNIWFVLYGKCVLIKKTIARMCTFALAQSLYTIVHIGLSMRCIGGCIAMGCIVGGVFGGCIASGRMGERCTLRRHWYYFA